MILCNIFSTAVRTTVNAQERRRINVNTCKYPDEAIEVAEYILKDMHTNANLGLTKKIKNHLNSIDSKILNLSPSMPNRR